MRPNWIKSGCYVLAYSYGAMACSLAVMVSIFLSLLPFVLQRSRENFMRWLIHRLSAGLVAYLQGANLLEVDFDGVDGLSQRKGAIIALNHPTYLDAVLILSRLPRVFCLTKASILRNPWFAATARCAGYESNADPLRLIENCRQRLQRGETLLIFPEGTRTATPPLGPLKRGFAVMAVETGAPVVTVLVNSYNGLFQRRFQPFLRLPESEILRYRFEVSREFKPETNESSKAFRVRIEKHFQASLPDSRSSF